MDVYTLAKIIEQVKEATIQIDKNTITGSRLALILIDNALELSMWEKISSEYSFEDYEAISNKTFVDKYPNFQDKTGFLKSKLIIDNDTKNVFDTCHHFRNEVYHQNITKELIIKDLAKIYLEECCKVVFKLFDYSFCTISYMKPIPQTLIEYGIVSRYYDITHDFAEKVSEIAISFLNGRMCSCCQFSQTLALDVIERIEKVRDDTKYIESVFSSNGDFKDEQRNLDSFLYRADKLKFAKNVSNALTRYYRIDIDLTPIELKMDLLSGLAGIEDDLRYQQYREEQH